MKKVIFWVLVSVLVSGFSFYVFSAPVHVPCRPLLGVQKDARRPANVALEGDFVIKRKLRGDISITRANWYSLKITEIFRDGKLQPYIIAGGLLDGRFKQEINNIDVKYITEDAFMWGVGTSVLLYEITDRLALGLDVKYRQTNPSIDRVSIDGNSFSLDDAGVSVDCDYAEWQASLGLCRASKRFLGYGGIKYSDVKATLEVEAGGVDEEKSVNSAHNIGVFLGMEYVITENTTIGIEGRFIDEQAYTLFITAHF
jgi:opacity protein-like surface antigen